MAKNPRGNDSSTHGNSWCTDSPWEASGSGGAWAGQPVSRRTGARSWSPIFFSDCGREELVQRGARTPRKPRRQTVWAVDWHTQFSMLHTAGTKNKPHCGGRRNRWMCRESFKRVGRGGFRPPMDAQKLCAHLTLRRNSHQV